MNPIKYIITKIKLYFLNKRLEDLNKKWKIIENTANNICSKDSTMNNIPYQTIKKFQNFSWAVRVNRTKTKTVILKLRLELKNG